MWQLAALSCLLYYSGVVVGDEGWFSALPLSGVGGTIMKKDGDDFKVYQNLWYHSMCFRAVEDTSTKTPNTTKIEWQILTNVGLMILPVVEAPKFYQNVNAGWVPGNTLLLDFPFPAFPENIGHWAEEALPIYSHLSLGRWRAAVQGGSRHIDTLLLANLRREQLTDLEWVWEVLKLALAPGLPEGMALPRLMFYDAFETMDQTMWLGFENLVVINDRYIHPEGRAGFLTPQLGHAFREAAYEAAGVRRPPGWSQGAAPRTITLLSAVGGEEVANRGELLEGLKDLGDALGLQCRPYTATTGAPFSSHVAAMARTGVLVSRHGPLLANTMFLPPGAVVLELLPYNWEWRGISRIYRNITRSLGDIHHFAWRARAPKWAAYRNPDEARYADWTAKECGSRQCLEVHAGAAMVADTATITELLAEVVPEVLRNASVALLEAPWPSLEADGATGLWWDK